MGFYSIGNSAITCQTLCAIVQYSLWSDCDEMLQANRWAADLYFTKKLAIALQGVRQWWNDTDWKMSSRFVLYWKLCHDASGGQTVVKWYRLKHEQQVCTLLKTLPLCVRWSDCGDVADWKMSSRCVLCWKPFRVTRRNTEPARRSVGPTCVASNISTSRWDNNFGSSFCACLLSSCWGFCLTFSKKNKQCLLVWQSLFMEWSNGHGTRSHFLTVLIFIILFSLLGQINIHSGTPVMQSTNKLNEERSTDITQTTRDTMNSAQQSYELQQTQWIVLNMNYKRLNEYCSADVAWITRDDE